MVIVEACGNGKGVGGPVRKIVVEKMAHDNSLSFIGQTMFLVRQGISLRRYAAAKDDVWESLPK